MQVPAYLLSSSFPLLCFILSCYAGIFLVLSGVCGPLLEFSRCSVRIILYVNVFLMHLWGEVNCMSFYSTPILTHPCQFLFLSFSKLLF